MDGRAGRTITWPSQFFALLTSSSLDTFTRRDGGFLVVVLCDVVQT